MTTGRSSTPLDPVNRISSPFWILTVCRSRNTDRPRTLAANRLAYTTAIAHTTTKQHPSNSIPMCAASENRVAVLVESPRVGHNKNKNNKVWVSEYLSCKMWNNNKNELNTNKGYKVKNKNNEKRFSFLFFVLCFSYITYVLLWNYVYSIITFKIDANNWTCSKWKHSNNIIDAKYFVLKRYIAKTRWRSYKTMCGPRVIDSVLIDLAICHKSEKMF